jgi:hypothetical protein
MGDIISCNKFTQFLVDQLPKYDKLIIETIRPMDGWIGHVSTGKFPANSGTSLYQDRFENVWPDTTKAWDTVATTSCLGTPCDKTEHNIGVGSSRLSYGLEEQSWQTPLFCFDQLMHITHAKDQFRQIIAKILKPATSAIQSMFLRKRALYWAGKKWVADSTMSDFSYIWLTVGDAEAYLLTNKMPTSKLTPQMLQRRVNPLQLTGYFGQSPFGEQDSPPLIELVADNETTWELDHLANVGAAGTSRPNVSSNWRFEQWDAANKYWRYGLSGKMGNYAIRVDPMQLRFNYMGASGNATYPYKFQLVLPFKNIASSGAGGEPGLKSVPNDDYQLAQYRMSFIWHKKAMECLVADASPINPQMPFSSRNFGGQWQFVMDNLGADVNGCVIENKRRNKGQFIADFKMAIRPLYTEFAEAIFHKGEPQCIYVVETCNTDPGYPTQTYNSANDACPAE